MNIERLKELVEIAVQPSSPIPPSIISYCEGYHSPYYNLMYLLAMEYMHRAFADDASLPPLCVELGVEGGRGSNAFLQGGAIVIGVDNNHKPEVDRIIGHKNFTFIHGSSLPPHESIREMGRCISVLHVDTEHSWAQAREEFNAYKPYLINGAVVLFDDTNAMEGEVKGFVETLPYDKFVDDRLHPQCGYAGIVFQDNA